MGWRYRAIVGLFAVPILQSQAHAECTVSPIANLPVTMEDSGPLIDAKINGAPVRFIADSGAFFSLISPGAAKGLNLQMNSHYEPFQILGVNGSATARATTVATFTLAGVDIHKVDFVVAGSEVGAAGVIGQNVLGIGDVEYDLPHGMIRLMRSKGCERANLAYWANDARTFSMIRIEGRSRAQPHTIATIKINGKPIRATFDTGAGSSLMSLQAAARLGLKPGGPGVTQGDATYGFGRRYIPTWVGKTDVIEIGPGEQIHNAKISFGAMTGDTDMLIGADFFIAHRVYVDNATHRMFLTYEGGPMFNTRTHYKGPDAVPGAKPAASVPTAAAGTPAQVAASYSREGAVALQRKDYDVAVSDFTHAIELAPTEARYLYQRSDAYFAQDKKAAARADLDKAITLAPDMDRLLTRADLLLDDDDRPGALHDLDAADRVAPSSAMGRMALGMLYARAGRPDRGIGQFDQWLAAHPDDVHRASALNGRCWSRAMAGTQLDQALADCNAALRLARDAPGILDSRGIVQLRRGDLVRARADFDAALAKDDGLAWSHYGRGIVRQRAGDAAGAKSDMAAAVKADEHIVEEAKAFGIVP